MSWRIVPSLRREAAFFGRHRDFFRDWFRHFDEGWRMMPFEESCRRFDHKMNRFRGQMHALNSQPFKKMEMESPFVTDSDGNRTLSLKVDCSQFKPEEITVKTVDGNLTIQAKRIEEDSNGKLYQEFVRNFTLPENVDPMTLKSSINKDGILQIEAPAPPTDETPKEHFIPIEQKMETSESSETATETDGK